MGESFRVNDPTAIRLVKVSGHPLYEALDNLTQTGYPLPNANGEDTEMLVEADFFTDENGEVHPIGGSEGNAASVQAASAALKLAPVKYLQGGKASYGATGQYATGQQAGQAAAKAMLGPKASDQARASLSRYYQAGGQPRTIDHEKANAVLKDAKQGTQTQRNQVADQIHQQARSATASSKVNGVNIETALYIADHLRG